MSIVHHDQRGPETLLIHEAFVEPSVFPHIETLVASVDHYRVTQKAIGLYIFKKSAYALIN